MVIAGSRVHGGLLSGGPGLVASRKAIQDNYRPSKVARACLQLLRSGWPALESHKGISSSPGPDLSPKMQGI